MFYYYPSTIPLHDNLATRRAHRAMEAQLANLVTTLTAFVKRLPTASQEARAASTSQAQSVGRSVKTILQTISTSFEHFDENAESFDNHIQRLANSFSP
ncbi:Hypothetical protein NTJ_02691 [Nesidiocoris tenuis]|uniref:Uncharacterized protein n=1 Tax=Nesidiocoris tenuis TaxID=355587 RepID=A0ABN7AEU6_9HEMI|nr:Hypothetical protein NTJ_02691 [Nesidiocoris tenuis]